MPIDGMVNRWKKAVDRQIAEVIGDGDISDLPGAGEKLPLQDESSAPAEWRLAFKIMNDHNVLPQWIAEGKRLEERETALRDQARKGARHRTRQPTGMDAAQKQRSDSNWKRFAVAYRERIGRYNRDVLLFNLKLPAGLPHRPKLDADDLLQRARVAPGD